MRTSSKAAGGAIVDADARRQRLDPLRLDRPVTAGMVGQVCDARHLEPDDVRGMVSDALRVGLGEAHADVVGAPESVGHGATIRREVPPAALAVV